MKSFDAIRFDAGKCREELADFRTLLETSSELEEREILQFFRDRMNLSACIGAINPKIETVDRIAFEYPLFGDFVCDLVVGDSANLAYCFVEFEDAGPRSIFVPKNREIPEWAPRFDHGFGQIIDWFWKLDDMSRTGDFEHRFGGRSIDYTALLVIGRNTLDRREVERLRWRQQHVLVNSKHIDCFTFDDLCNTLDRRIRLSLTPERPAD